VLQAGVAGVGVPGDSLVRLPVGQQAGAGRGPRAVCAARPAQGRARHPRAPGRAAPRAPLPGLRARPVGGAGAAAHAAGLQPRRLRVPQGRRRQGDVHRQARPADRGRRRRPHCLRYPRRRQRLRGGQSDKIYLYTGPRFLNMGIQSFDYKVCPGNVKLSMILKKTKNTS